MPKNEWHWEMTDDELWIAFRDAKNKKEIVRILADRNVTIAKRVVDKLREIVAANGYPNDGLDHIPAIGRYSNAEVDIIREMAASGASIEMIAQKLDRTPGSVDTWMLRNRVYPAAIAAVGVVSPSAAFAPAEPTKIRVPQAVIDALKARLGSMAGSISAMSSDQEAIRAFLSRCEAEPVEVDHE